MSTAFCDQTFKTVSLPGNRSRTKHYAPYSKVLGESEPGFNTLNYGAGVITGSGGVLEGGKMSMLFDPAATDPFHPPLAPPREHESQDLPS